MEKIAKLTKAELQELKEILARETGLAKVIQLAGREGASIEASYTQFFTGIKKRLKINISPTERIFANSKTGDIRWNDPEEI